MKKRRMLSLLLSLGMVLSLFASPFSALAVEVEEQPLAETMEEVSVEEPVSPEQTDAEPVAEEPEEAAEVETVEIAEAAAEETVSAEAALAEANGEVYVLMNIPYADFYAGEGVEGVDAVTTATVKTFNQNMAGGSYHDGYITEDAKSGKILGVTYPVYVADTALLEGLKAVAVNDTATITVAAGKSALTTKEVSGADLLFASGDYAYMLLDEVPANFKTMTVEDGKFVFSAVEKKAETKTITEAELTYGGHYTDLTLSVDAPEFTSDSVVTAILLTAGEETYAFRHVEDVWRKTELGWNWDKLDGKGLAGKTITNITYYLKDGGVYSYDVNVPVKQHADGEISAVFAASYAVRLSGLPADIQNPVVTVATKVGRGETPVVIADNAKLYGTTAVTDKAVPGTVYNITVNSDNYATLTTSAQCLALGGTAVTLSKSSFTYNGKAQSPAVTVQAGETALTEGTDYVVRYMNNVMAGTASAVVIGVGDWSGVVVQSYKINAVALKAAGVTLNKTSLVYTGKALTPAVTVKNGSTVLKNGSDYTVKFSGNTKVGTAKVTVTGKGNYSGTITKTFTIVPKGTTLKKVTAGSKQFTAAWKKQATQTTGYQIQYATNKGFTKNVKTVTVKGNAKTSAVVKSLKAKTTYYVRVRTYQTVRGKNYYAPWSAVKNVKTK